MIRMNFRFLAGIMKGNGIRAQIAIPTVIIIALTVWNVMSIIKMKPIGGMMESSFISMIPIDVYFVIQTPDYHEE